MTHGRAFFLSKNRECSVVYFFKTLKSSNFVLHEHGYSFESLGICLLYHVDGDAAFTSFIMRNGFRYIRILPNVTIQQSIFLST